jgi:LPXTG-motif cell wall-anchored protein
MDTETKLVGKKEPHITKKTLLAVIALMTGGGLLLAGGISVFAYNLGTDSEGYAYSNVYHVNTSTYGFTLYMNEYKLSTWGFLGASTIAEMKYIARPTNGKKLFIGYATTTASQAYGDSFQREIPTYWRWWAEPYYAEISISPTAINGTGAPQPPQNQTFWLASNHSSMTAAMTYLPLKEQHVWYVMNLDGSQNVSADIQIAFRSPILTILPYILILIGIIMLASAVYFLRRKKTKGQ